MEWAISSVFYKNGGNGMQIIKRTQDEVQVNLLGVVALLWKKVIVILFACLLGSVLAFAGTYFLVTPKYTANITLYVNNTSTSDATTTITSSDLTASAKLVDTYAAIISSKTVLNQVREEAGVDIEVSTLASMISTSSINATEVFRVSVESSDPKEAARIANAIAEIAPEQISEIVDGSSVKVVDRADIPTAISSPDYAKYAIAGAVVGFIISVAVILIRELLDTTIKTEADLEGWGLPILGVVPEFTSAAKRNSYGYQHGKRVRT